jgi:hypothetical protein
VTLNNHYFHDFVGEEFRQGIVEMSYQWLEILQRAGMSRFGPFVWVLLASSIGSPWHVFWGWDSKNASILVGI